MIIRNIKKLLISTTPQLYPFIKGVANILGIGAFTKRVNKEDFFIEPDFSKNQHFFTKSTAIHLVTKYDNHKYMCCLCTPRLAYEWSNRGKKVTLLDVDEKFKFIPGYQYYDVTQPIDLEKEFDLIIVDPPFSLPAHEIRKSIDVLASRNKNATLCICFPLEREKELFTAFSAWNLNRIELENLKWNNIKDKWQKCVGFYSNRLMSLFIGFSQIEDYIPIDIYQ